MQLYMPYLFITFAENLFIQISNRMAKIRLLLIVFLSITLSAHSQQKITKFERELNEFRYSLYEILDTIPFDVLRNMDVGSFKGLQDKIDTFIAGRSKDIYKYKADVLHQYKDTPLPDLNNYKPVQTEEIDAVNSMIKDQLRDIKYMYDLLTINPISTVHLYISLFSGYFGAEGLIAESVKAQIAACRISAQRRSKDTWLIFADKYNYVFEFTYSLEDNLLRFDNAYERKKHKEQYD